MLYASVPMLSVLPTAMMTSSLILLKSAAILSKVALPSGFNVDLSKSYKVSACKVILLWVTAGAGLAAAGAGLAGGFGAIQPSQFAIAEAGVQLLSRQHRVPSEFFQGNVPSEPVQLSLPWAIAALAEIVITEASNSFTVLFIFCPQKSLLKIMSNLHASLCLNASSTARPI